MTLDFNGYVDQIYAEHSDHFICIIIYIFITQQARWNVSQNHRIYLRLGIQAVQLPCKVIIFRHVISLLGQET